MRMKSIVVTEIKASLMRQRLLDRLSGRTDIIAPGTVRDSLTRGLARYLVAGVDDDRVPGTGGWPVPTGGRYVKLCFSPIVERMAADLPSPPHRLPVTQTTYAEYVARITGIGASDASDFARIYRFDPAELHDRCRAMIAECPDAWRLLLSNEFALACRLWPQLKEVQAGSGFRYPLVDGFRIIAELERGSLIMRHLGRSHTLLSRPDFLEKLASPLPLRGWFKPDEIIEVCRWIEYMMFSSAALSEMLFSRTEQDVEALPGGYPLRAIAYGVTIGPAAAFLDHPEVRKALVAIVTKPALQAVTAAEKKDPDWTAPVEKRTGMLRNHELCRWYSLTNEAFPLVVLDGAREPYPLGAPVQNRSKVTSENSRPVLARLGAAMRMRADPTTQAKIAGASEKYLNGSKLGLTRVSTSEKNTKMGLKMALTYLPPKGRMGSAARFDPSAWSEPDRDGPFWRILLDIRRGSPLHRMPHVAKHQLRTALGITRRAYGPFLSRLKWSAEVERVVCDLACAISPISADMHIAFAIDALARNSTLQQRLQFEQRRPGYGYAKPKSGKRR